MGKFRHLFLLLLLAGCQPGTPAPSPRVVLEPPETGGTWQDVATSEDVDRIAGLDATWQAALAAAAAEGLNREIEAEGALLDPGAALPRAALPPGSYRCRVLRFPAPPRRRAFIAYRHFFCHVGVEDELLSFTKQTGSERPGGYIWPDSDMRQIFLGSMALGEEEGPPAYAADPDRDLIGMVERVGPFRYRIVFPRPSEASALDILDLVPLAPGMD